jgi:hypothetical protein
MFTPSYAVPDFVLDRTSQTFVRKKAALTLLRLYRKHPEVISAQEWALRIVSIMDDEDLVSVTGIKIPSCLSCYCARASSSVSLV